MYDVSPIYIAESENFKKLGGQEKVKYSVYKGIY